MLAPKRPIQFCTGASVADSQDGVVGRVGADHRRRHQPSPDQHQAEQLAAARSSVPPGVAVEQGIAPRA